MEAKGNDIIINEAEFKLFLEGLKDLSKGELNPVEDKNLRLILDSFYKMFENPDSSSHGSSLFQSELQVNDLIHKELIFSRTDAKGNITEVNSKFCELSGYSREELIGKNHRIVKSDKHSDSFYLNMWETISSGEIWRGIVENKKKDGSPYFVKAYISPFYDQEENIAGYLSLRNDVTSQIIMRNNLKRTLDTLNETSRIAKVGGWDLDVNSKSLNWTDETYQIFELKKDKKKPPTLIQSLGFYTDESRPLVEEAIEQAVNKGIPFALELQLKTSKGKLLWVSVIGNPVYKDGNVCRISGTIQNINEKKLAELKYEEERVKNLHSAKLASLGEMSAGIAHEINNPLTIIAGTISILKNREQTASELEKRLEMIEKSADRISKIVGSLKKFSRFSDTENYTPHRLSKIVEESLVLTNIKCKSNDIELTSEIGSNVSVLCNEIEIEQVLINLINNSADAIKELDERWIKIELEEEKSFVTLKVTDSGSGIPPEKASRMFDPFFTTKEVGEGTGLGLSITASILNQHNALIRINQKHPNTQFIIHFNKYFEDEEALNSRA